MNKRRLVPCSDSHFKGLHQNIAVIDFRKHLKIRRVNLLILDLTEIYDKGPKRL